MIIPVLLLLPRLDIAERANGTRALQRADFIEWKRCRQSKTDPFSKLL
jgi:hypothetical protein